MAEPHNTIAASMKATCPLSGPSSSDWWMALGGLHDNFEEKGVTSANLIGQVNDSSGRKLLFVAMSDPRGGWVKDGIKLGLRDTLLASGSDVEVYELDGGGSIGMIATTDGFTYTIEGMRHFVPGYGPPVNNYLLLRVDAP